MEVGHILRGEFVPLANCNYAIAKEVVEFYYQNDNKLGFIIH